MSPVRLDLCQNLYATDLYRHMHVTSHTLLRLAALNEISISKT